MKRFAPLLISFLLLLTSCADQPAAPTSTPAALVDLPESSQPGDCSETTYTAPETPAEIPGYLDLDPATGLHMTGVVQEIDLPTYRLKISGLVDHPLELRYEELRCLPKISDDPLLICEGFFEDKATWAGVPLVDVLNLAGVQPEASEITLVSADGYQVGINLNEAQQEKNFLAYEVNGEMLPILHGFPLRAVFPGKNGNFWLKWLVEIRVN
jgi:DMSO/TMAO reductase YedYZ molybdopterin-dependent catalytic subunit